MCTLITLHGCVPGAWLVAAANRDEALERPADPPALRQGPAGPYLAPRDRLAGGTWIGLGGRGVFAAVTNRAGRPRDDRRRSRGLVVLDALSAASAREAVAAILTLPPDSVNPFNLYVADPREAYVVAYDEKPRARRLAPGVHVLGNGEPGGEEAPKIERLRRAVEATSRSSREGLLEGLAVVCRTHAPGRDPLDGVCIHTEAYGTRSSSLIWLGEPDSRWLHAEGPPCRATYRDFTPLLDRLRGAAQPAPGEFMARGDR